MYGRKRGIKRRLEWWVQNNKLLPKSQYDFRKGRGTENNIRKFIANLYLKKISKKYVLVLFCGIK